MKPIHYLPAILLVACLSACIKENTGLPVVLTNAKEQLEEEFKTLNKSLSDAAALVLQEDIDTVYIRFKLSSLYEASQHVAEFCWVNPAGILQMIEPSEYYGSQGTDISTQDHIVKSFTTKEPALSKVFRVVEGYDAAALIHPINDREVFGGGLVAVIRVEDMLGAILLPLVTGQDFELWAMEAGGRIIYDQDTDEIGRNLFTDPLYSEFTELLAAGHKIDEEESGSTKYSFYKTGTTEQVTKNTFWTTVETYGTQWKLVWVKAE